MNNTVKIAYSAPEIDIETMECKHLVCASATGENERYRESEFEW